MTTHNPENYSREWLIQRNLELESDMYYMQALLSSIAFEMDERLIEGRRRGSFWFLNQPLIGIKESNLSGWISLLRLLARLPRYRSVAAGLATSGPGAATDGDLRADTPNDAP